MTKRRGNKEGSIYKRGNRWCAQVRVNGRRLTKYGDTQGEVREWLKETISQVDNGLTITPKTLGEFLPSWLETMKPSIKARSYETYEVHIRQHIVPELGQIKLQELRPDHIQRFYATKVTEGAGASTLRLCHAILHRALAHAVKWGLLARNVCEAVDRPKASHVEMSTWNGEQVRRFLNAVKGHRWEALFYLAVTTGLRRGELLGLMWSDLDWNTGKLSIQRQAYKLKLVDLKRKTSRRPITLGEIALQKLRERQERQAREKEWGDWTDTGLIFTSRTGQPISAQPLRKVFKEMIEKASVPEIRFHDLRHTAATLMLQQGVHPKVVQERLGHSSISMTLDIYSHVLPSLQEDAADRMERFLQWQ